MIESRRIAGPVVGDENAGAIALHLLANNLAAFKIRDPSQPRGIGYFDGEPLAWHCGQGIIVCEMVQYAKGISNVSQWTEFGTWYPAALGFEVPIRGWAPSQDQPGNFVYKEAIYHFVFAASLGKSKLSRGGTKAGGFSLKRTFDPKKLPRSKGSAAQLVYAQLKSADAGQPRQSALRDPNRKSIGSKIHGYNRCSGNLVFRRLARSLGKSRGKLERLFAEFFGLQAKFFSHRLAIGRT